MNAFQKLLETPALDILEHFDKQLAIDSGMATAEVNRLVLTHATYFGPTTSPQKQRLAARDARRTKFSLDQLAMIERELSSIKDRRTRDKLRLEIFKLRGNYKQLMAAVKKLVPKAEKRREKKITISQSRNRTRTMSITADERDIADLEQALLDGLDKKSSPGKHMLQKFLTLVREGGGVGRAVPRPLLLIPLESWTKIIRGEGDEVLLGLSDGTTITGAEYLELYHSTILGDGPEVAIFHPQEGPVNLYRTERFANQKQRDLARATSPVCLFPDCRHGADHCQIHHIVPWKDGGGTNMANLAPLCRYHNRVNDDDPSEPKRGRIEVIDGDPTWVSPTGRVKPNPYHPYGAMQTLFRESQARDPQPDQPAPGAPAAAPPAPPAPPAASPA